jgi:hypothetical protein
VTALYLQLSDAANQVTQAALTAVNGTGQVSAQDYQAVASATTAGVLAGLTDVDGDGQVNTLDYQAIVTATAAGVVGALGGPNVTPVPTP